VAESTRVGDLLSAVRQLADDLAETVEVFDLYTGKQIGQGRKSVAMALVLRAADRSLANVEVDELMVKIVSHLKDNYGAEIRDW